MKPVPMCLEHANILGMTLPEPKFVENLSRYGQFNFPRKSPPNLEKTPVSANNFGSGAGFGGTAKFSAVLISDFN